MKINITVTVLEDQPFRLVPYSENGQYWIKFQGHRELVIFASNDHPEARRLHAAVAAFNAVMDGDGEGRP